MSITNTKSNSIFASLKESLNGLKEFGKNVLSLSDAEEIEEEIVLSSELLQSSAKIDQWAEGNYSDVDEVKKSKTKTARNTKKVDSKSKDSIDNVIEGYRNLRVTPPSQDNQQHSNQILFEDREHE